MNTRAPWRKPAFLACAALVAGAAAATLSPGCDSGSDGAGSGNSPPSMVVLTLAEPQLVVVSWKDNSSGEQGFLIERQAGAGEFKEVGRTSANVTEYRDTTVSQGREYLYRVAALDGAGMASAFSEDAMIDVPDAP